MATVHLAFRNMVDVGGSSLIAPPRVSQSMTSAATSAASTIAALAGEVATITASGGNVYLSYGSAPVASAAGPSDLLLDGQTITIAGLTAGTKIAVIDPAV